MPHTSPIPTAPGSSVPPCARHVEHESHLRRLASDVRGALLVEYVALVALVAVVLTLMLATLGPLVVDEYSIRRATLYSHSP
jgi:Flp pilus assembly pilin Flp